MCCFGVVCVVFVFCDVGRCSCVVVVFVFVFVVVVALVVFFKVVDVVLCMLLC